MGMQGIRHWTHLRNDSSRFATLPRTTLGSDGVGPKIGCRARGRGPLRR